MNFFASKKAAPATVPTDEIVPMFQWDDQPHNREIVVVFTYRFDHVLDNDKLKRSLERLLEMGEWRKIGARIRLNSNGKLDHHIPESFSEQRPGFLWSHKDLAEHIENHPLASQLPQAKAEPTIFGQSSELVSFAAHPDHPKCLGDWIYSDRPLLSIQLVTFANASLLTLTWSHTFLDAVGFQTLLTAWTAVLDDREQDVPQFICYKDDPVKNMGLTTSPEKHILYSRLVSGFSFFLFVAYMIQEKILHPQETARVIQIPDSFVQNLKQEVDTYFKERGQETPFLSDGDILYAWFARLIVSSQSYSPKRTVNLMNVFTYRGISPHLPLDKAYMGNAVDALQSFLTVEELVNQPIAVTALQVRTNLVLQRTPENIEASVALARKLGRGPLFGTSDQVMCSWSNWIRARFYDFDFSAAVVAKGAKSVGKPTYISPSGYHGNISVRNASVLIGKDANDNWWIQTTLRAEAWKIFEERFLEATRERSH